MLLCLSTFLIKTLNCVIFSKVLNNNSLCIQQINQLYHQQSINIHINFVYRIGLYFGLILCFGGIGGVITGAAVAGYLKKNVMKEGDAIVCAIGIALSGTSLYLCLVFGALNIVVAWVLG